MRDRVFISYRRDDARDAAGRLYERLARRFGRRRLFMDVDDIERGADFRKVLERHLAETKVLLVVIGPTWLDARDRAGARRLDNPADFVRLEVANALRSDADVVPVLVGGARMPQVAELPDDISDLAYRQNIELRGDYFGHDAGLLEEIVARKLKRVSGSARWAAGVAVALGLAGAAGWIAVGGGAPPRLDIAGGAGPAETPAETPTETPTETEAQGPEDGAEDVAAESPRPADARAAWLQVRDSDDIDALAAFRAAHPGSAFDAAAAERLSALYAAAWGAVRDRRDPDDVQAFRRRYPASPFDADAAALLAEIDQDYRAAQTELRRLGLYDGPVDGIWGARSAAALRGFEAARGLPEDGAPSPQDLAALRAVATPPELLPDLARFQECDQCPEMVVIPGGAFTMGSPDDEPGRYDDEGPQRRVTVPRFALGKTEVTFAEWDACVSAGGCSQRPGDEGWGRGQRPVINVSWNDAQAYVAWLNRKVGAEVYRLPSEAEWEYAARAGTTTRFSFGDSDDGLGDHAWYWSNAGRKTHPVGGKRPNAFGLHDMHGNVWEWVQDCWNDSYRGAPSTGAPWMSGDCSRAVLRGGSWGNLPRNLRSAYRDWYGRADRDNDIGFRVARVSRTLRE